MVELGTPAAVMTHLESVEDLADHHEQHFAAKPEKVLCHMPRRYGAPEVKVLDCTHLVEFSRDHDHDFKRRLSESHCGSGS